MASVELRPAAPGAIPQLESGDHLTRDEFERRYAAMPGQVKAELIGGRVYVASPSRYPQHGGPQFDLILWLGTYRLATPGVEGADNTTVRLDDENEPRPDGVLFISADCGGQCRIDDEGYIIGAPEFIAEVASSSASYDLHDKLEVYRAAGVQEYVVWRVTDQAIDWFAREDDKFVRLEADKQGTICSRVLPGLWLDGMAMLRREMPAVMACLQQGLATADHADFVRRLASGRD